MARELLVVRVGLSLIVLGVAGCHLIFPYDTYEPDAADAGQKLDQALADQAGATADGHAEGAPDGSGCIPDCDARECMAEDGCGGICLAACTGVDAQWVESFGGTCSPTSPCTDSGNAVAVGLDGNITFTGFFEGSATFGGSPLNSVDDSLDIFVASYRPDGSHIWSERFGGESSDIGHGVVVDSSGNVTVVGGFSAEANFGGGAFSSAGGYDIFVASFEADGTHRWSKRFGAAEGDIARDVAVDGSGNVTVTGQFSGAMSVEGGDGEAFTSAGGYDIFVASFGADGKYRWAKSFGGVGDDLGYGVAVDSSGNVTVVGSFSDQVNFGGETFESAGGDDIFVARFDADGKHSWSKSFGAAEGDIARDVAADGDGNVALVGTFGAKVDFGGGFFVSAGRDDVFVASFDSAGEHRWSKSAGGPLSEAGNGIAIDAKGNVTITGGFRDQLDFGTPLTTEDPIDIFVVSFDSGGGHRWSEHFGGSSNEAGFGVAAAASGHVMVTGNFQSSADFQGKVLTSKSGADAFLLRLVPAP